MLTSQRNHPLVIGPPNHFGWMNGFSVELEPRIGWNRLGVLSDGAGEAGVPACIRGGLVRNCIEETLAQTR